MTGFWFCGDLGDFLAANESKADLEIRDFFCSVRWLLANSCVACLSFEVWVGVFLTHLISCDIPFLCIICHFSLEVSLKFVLKKSSL